VKEGKCPSDEHCYPMVKGELPKLLEKTKK